MGIGRIFARLVTFFAVLFLAFQLSAGQASAASHHKHRHVKHVKFHKKAHKSHKHKRKVSKRSHARSKKRAGRKIASSKPRHHRHGKNRKFASSRYSNTQSDFAPESADVLFPSTVPVGDGLTGATEPATTVQ